MPSVLNSTLVDPTQAIDLKVLGAGLGAVAPYSLRGLLGLVQTQSFHQVITTAGLESLGGTVDLTISSDGTYDISIHMHDSGLASYQFKVVVVVTSADIPDPLQDPRIDPAGQQASIKAFVIDCEGSVEGTDSAVPFGHKPRRDFDWHQRGTHEFIKLNWRAFRAGAMNVSKAYSHARLLGTIEDAFSQYVLETLTFVFGTAVIGLAPVAAIAYLSSKFSEWTGVRFLGPAGLVGLISAAGVLYLMGPTMVFPVFVGGAAIGALALPSQRKLTDDEIKFGQEVFGNTIPWDQIILSDLVGIGGRPFTMPGIDGSIIINLGVGNCYSDPVHGVVSFDCRNRPGQFFVHELTHAWQIANGSWQGLLCGTIGVNLGGITKGLVKMYSYGSADVDWSAFNIEQQAVIVEEWFGGTRCFATNRPATRTPRDAKDPYYRYIAGNIRTGLT